MARETTFICNAQITCVRKGARYLTAEQAAEAFKRVLESSDYIDDAVVSDVKVFVNDREAGE